ncbi:SDR family NAD(P)-dependent oxidoreductase [Nonomuraea sp. NPDC050790]|uniref:SDR family NAD(P)-dependent oxidoreductase n=1 Tax=Nonomuraea sp. NPDC050790 TaxID=3364371 RepID=UPI0037877B8E
MQTVVITGGADRIGKGPALHYLQHGAHVIAIGGTAGKGQALLAEAKNLPARRAGFVCSDLTSVAATQDLVKRLTRGHPVVDKLILCARRYPAVHPGQRSPWRRLWRPACRQRRLLHRLQPTAMPESLPQPLRAATKAFFTLFATSVPKAIAPMTALPNDPPTPALHRPLATAPTVAGAPRIRQGLRLHGLTRELIAY